MTDTRHSSNSNKHWKLNWWDLWPLVDNDKRPLQWTSESLILSAHPAPAVSARLFPTSYTFLLPSPPLILGNPNAYLPPTIIEASPAFDYIFAYFPGKTEDNLACVWSRCHTLDSWKLDTSWVPKRGHGFVLAKWLGRDRSWSPGSPPVRGCSLGPINPLGSSRLLLVTQNHAVQLVDRILPYPPFQLASASLLHASRSSAAERVPLKEMVNGPGGVSICTKAAVGLGYNENSLIIATQSSLIASSTSLDFPDFTAMNQTSFLPPTATSSWDSFGSENTIQLCEVRLLANRFQLGVETKPLPPIFPRISSFAYLTDMSIVPVCSAHQEQSIGSKRESQMYLTLVYVDLEDYCSPKCHLLSYRLERKEPQQNRPKRSDWTHVFVTNKTLTDSAVTFIVPSRRDESGVIFAGLVDLHSSKPTENNDRDSQQVAIGKIIALKLPLYDNDPRWEPANLIGLPNETGPCIPMSAALSPNETLLCTTNSYWDHSTRLGVYPIVHINTPSVIGAHSLQEILAASILSIRSNVDVLHLLSGPNIKDRDASQILSDCFSIIRSQNSMRRDVEYDIIKVLIALFRERVRLSTRKKSQSLYERSDIALDICSIRAIKNAFSLCKEEVGYDMDPAWNLIALFLWFMDFLERLLRDLILLEGYLTVSGDLKKLASVVFEEIDKPMGDDSNSSFVPSSLIHLVHPYALHNLIEALSHLNAFRAYLDTLTASKPKSNLAKEVILDAQDNSGLNLKEIELEVRKIPQMEEFKSLSETVFQKSLCRMQPLPETYPLLAQICRQILRSEAVSKSRIFIEVKEVVIGVSKPASGSLQCDIISKATLLTPNNIRMCAVCKGKTEVGNFPLPKGKDVTYSSWALWEHDWNRCICGGIWIKPTKKL